MNKQVISEIQGTTVLVVDDDVDFTEMMRNQLEHIGMKVVGVAHNGPDALDMIKERDPGLVMLDIRMEGMDGIEVARIITRTEPRPVMFLSAHPEYAPGARDTGVFTYLVKTSSIEKMVPSIVMTLNHFREMSALKAMMESMRESVENESAINSAAGRLMDTKGITRERAMEEIRKRCRETNKPLADVAKELAEG